MSGIQSVSGSSVPVIGSAGQPVRGQATTEAPVPQAKKSSNEQQNPKEWSGTGSKEEITKAVDESNDLLASIKSGLQFGVDEDTGRMIVKVIDSDTGEVIRQLPSKEMLEVAKALKSLTSGLFLNEKV
jgi:flagellar protein FlaG